MAEQIGINVKLDSTDADKSLNRLLSSLNKIDDKLNRFQRDLNKSGSNTSKVINSTSSSLKGYGKVASTAAAETKRLSSSLDGLASYAKRAYAGLRHMVELNLSKNIQELVAAFSPLKVSNIASDFLGFRNALMVTADSSSSLSEKLAVGEERLAASSKIAKEFKIDLVATNREYSKFINASVLAGQSLEIAESQFRTFSKVARITNMDGQQLSGMFLALEQMISKGFVSMEELRRQLGQYIPGAMNIAARAWGKGKKTISEFYEKVKSGTLETIPFLKDFAKEMNKIYGEDVLAKALEKPSAALTELKNSFVALQASIGLLIAKPLTKFVNFITELINRIGSLVSSSKDLKQTFDIMFGVSAIKKAEDAGVAIKNVSESVTELTENADTLVDKVVSFKESLEGSFIGSLGTLAAQTVAGAAGIAAMTGALSGLSKIFKIAFSPLGKILTLLSRWRLALFAVGAAIGALTSPVGIAVAAVTAFTTAIVYAMNHFSPFKEKVAESTDAVFDFNEALKRTPKPIENARQSIEDYEASIIKVEEKIRATIEAQKDLRLMFDDAFVTDTEKAIRHLIAITDAQRNSLAQLQKVKNEYNNRGLTEAAKKVDESIAAISASLLVNENRLYSIKRAYNEYATGHKYFNELNVAGANYLAELIGKNNEYAASLETGYKKNSNALKAYLLIKGKFRNLTDEMKNAIMQEAIALDKSAESTEKKTQAVQELTYAQKEHNAAIIAAKSDIDVMQVGFTDIEWIDGFKDTIAETAEETQTYVEEISVALGNILANSLDDAASSIVDFVMTGKQSFADMAKSVLADIAKMILQIQLLRAAQAMFPSFFGGASSNSGQIISGSLDLSSYMPLAKGGIVTKPTLSLIGEAGPEAVIPLNRSSNKAPLSVNQNINIINNAGSDTEVTTKQSQDGLSLDVMIERKVNKMIVNGNFNRSMSTAFGLRRQAI